MNAWLKKITTTLLIIVLASGLVRLAWELLRPAVPTLVALLVAFVVLRIVLRGPKGW
jgi:hypothetical protein